MMKVYKTTFSFSNVEANKEHIQKNYRVISENHIIVEAR